MTLKDTLLQLLKDTDDAIVEVEDSEIDDADVKAEVLSWLDEAQSSITDAIKVL